MKQAWIDKKEKERQAKLNDILNKIWHSWLYHHIHGTRQNRYVPTF